ncbi:MAG: hypothetical protein KDD66_03500 [Bdellovibrionales bacterium]|nr:hypothetical protein [Bdellovibrionales bacterium]
MPGCLRSESGNTALYATVVLPIVITLAVVGMDISTWQSLRQNAQREVDRIAYEASLFLPNDEAAAQHVYQSVAALPQLELALSQSGQQLLNITTSSVTFTAKVEHKSVFDHFLAASSGANHFFNAYASSSASTVPEDVVLIVSDANSLRPPAYNTWGNAIDWPASSYFNLIGQPSYVFDPPNEPPIYWPQWWESDFFTETFRRWATQLCYNAAVTPLKLAAMQITDVLGSGALNRTAVLFTPGDAAGGAGFSLGKALLFADEPAAATHWSGYYEARSASGNEACVYFADETTTTNQRYALPSPPFAYISPATSLPCSNRIAVSPLGSPVGHQPDPALGRLEDCFVGGGASVQEIIYFHAVRPHPHEANGGNITRAAAFALAALIQGTHVPTQEALDRRKNLTSKVVRRIVVLTDFLPDPGDAEFTTLLSELEQAAKATKLTFLVFQHTDLPASTKALNEARAASINAASPNASAQLATDAEELNRLAGSFIHKDRQLALRI